MNQHLQSRDVVSMQVGELPLVLQLQEDMPDDWDNAKVASWFDGLSNALGEAGAALSKHANGLRASVAAPELPPDPQQKPDPQADGRPPTPFDDPPEPVDPNKIGITIFGDWRQKMEEVTFSEAGKKVIAFLENRKIDGKPVRVTKPVADGIRAQLQVLNVYRSTLEVHLKSSIARLQKMAQMEIPKLDPPMDAAEAYERGMMMGWYHALLWAAQILQDALNAAHKAANK